MTSLFSPQPPPAQQAFIPEPEVDLSRDVSDIDKRRRARAQPSLIDLLSGQSQSPTLL